MLQKTRKIQECDMGKYGTLDSREKTIAILGDRWPQTAIWEGDKISKKFPCTYGKNVVRAQTLEVSLCLLYTSPSPRDRQKSRMPSSA